MIGGAWSTVKSAFAGRCVYCGARCYGSTCPEHRDLPQLEHDVSPLQAQSAPRLVAETSATRSDSRGA